MADVVPSTVTREVARGALTPSLTHPGTGAMMFERADVEEWVRSRTAQASDLHATCPNHAPEKGHNGHEPA